jgi:hypothetical protein
MPAQESILKQFGQQYYIKCGRRTNNLNTNTQDYSNMTESNGVRCSWHTERQWCQCVSWVSSSWHSEGQWHHHVSWISVVTVVKEPKRNILFLRHSHTALACCVTDCMAMKCTIHSCCLNIHPENGDVSTATLVIPRNKADYKYTTHWQSPP